MSADHGNFTLCQGAEPQERAWWPQPHDSDTLGGSLVSRAAREPSRPADRGKLADVSGSDPARKYSSYAVAGKTKASRKTYKNRPYCKSRSYPCRGSAKGQSASSRLVQWRDNLTIGTHHYKELQIGTNGLTKTPLSNWPVTCVAVPFQNGPCSEKRRKKH